jgi:hypothetical protein
VELEDDEALVRLGKKVVVSTRRTERAQREGLEQMAWRRKWRSLAFDSVSVADRDQSIQTGRDDARSEHPHPEGLQLEQALELGAIFTQKSEPLPGGDERGRITSPEEPVGPLLELAGGSLGADRRMRDRREEQGTVRCGYTAWRGCARRLQRSHQLER